MAIKYYGRFIMVMSSLDRKSHDADARSHYDAYTTTTDADGRSQSDRAGVGAGSNSDASTTTKLAFTSKRLEESESDQGSS